MSLSSKERMQIAMEHKEPDRVPYYAAYVPELERIMNNKYEKGIKDLGVDFKQTVHGFKPLDKLLGHDILLLGYGLDTSYYRECEGNTYEDEWGIIWQKNYYETKFGKGYYTVIKTPPLVNNKSIDSYNPPNPNDEDYNYAENIIKKFGNNYYIVGVIANSTFEALRYLRGEAQGIMDIVLNKDIASKIMNMSADYHLAIGKRLAKLGVDMLFLGDDVGSEGALMISPESFREMIKPILARMINELKKVNRDVKIAFHSDGYIIPIIEDLVEIGVDLLNPIQPESMDPNYIKKRFGKKIALWGTISTQKTMPFGSICDVENEIRDRIEYCAPGGGFLIAPTHNFQLDVPLENIETFYKAVKKYGKYPIRL